MYALTEVLSMVLSRSGLSEILMGSAIKCSFVLLLCLTILYAWRRGAAATRHFILTLGLLSCLLIPLTSAIWLGIGSSSIQSINALEIILTAVGGSPLSGAAVWGNLNLPDWWTWIIMIWVGGVLLFSLRALAGFMRVRSLLKHAPAIGDVRLQELLNTCIQKVGLLRPVRLLAHDASRIPFTCGLLRPAVVLGTDAAEMTDDETRRVLLHELAHIRRHDVATNMAAQLVIILFWFNPLVWLAVRQLHHERERACDDYVLASGEPPTEYAEFLLTYARRLSKRVSIIPTGITFVRASALGHRIRSLFKPGNRIRTVGFVTLAALSVSALATVGILSCIRTPTSEDSPTSDLVQADRAPDPNEFIEVDAMPVMIHPVDPEYPKALAEAGVSGEVWVQALVDRTGSVRDAKIPRTSGYAEFDAAALAAARECRYEPAQQNGGPVEVWVTYKCSFALSDK